MGGATSTNDEDIMIIRTGLAPEIAPLPVAQVQFTRLRLLPAQQHPGASEIVFLERLLDSVHVGAVSGAASGEGFLLRFLFRRLRLHQPSPLIVPRRFGFPLRFLAFGRPPPADRT